MPLFILSGPLIPDMILISSSIFFLTKYKKNLFNELRINWLIVMFWMICISSSLLSDHFLYSLKSSFFYLRFLIYSCFIWYLLKKNIFNLSLFFKILFSIYLFLVIDSHFQFFFGFNLFGFKSESGLRISSVFGSELIMGSFLLKILPLFLAIILVEKLEKIIFLLPIIYSSIILSGERTTIILSVLFLLVFLKINISLKLKIINIFLIFTVFSLHFFLNKNFNYNITDRIKEEVVFNSKNNDELDKKKLEYNKVLPFNIFTENHTRIYNTSFLMFLDKKILGHGPKSFRKKCNIYDPGSCATHSHNHIFQILSEVGTIGFIGYIIIFLTLLKRNIQHFFSKKKFSDVNFILTMSIIINFFPFLPSGNFFNNFFNIIAYFPLGFYFFYYDLGNKKI